MGGFQCVKEEFGGSFYKKYQDRGKGDSIR